MRKEETKGMAGIMEKQGKRKKKRKIWPIIVVAVLVVGYLGLRAVGTAAAEKIGAIVTTTAVTRGDLQESISTGGTVYSEVVRVVYAPVTGTVEEVKVEPGDAVKAGQQLITYDMKAMEKALYQSSLQMKRSFAGYDNAMEQDAESIKKLNEAKTNLKVLEQQIADNEGYLEQLQNLLSEYQRNTSKALAEEAIRLQAELNHLIPGTEEYSTIAAAMSTNSYQQQTVGTSEEDIRLQKEISKVQGLLAEYREMKAKMEAQKTSSEAMVMNDHTRLQYDVDSELADISYQETLEQYEIAGEGIVAEFAGVITRCSAVEGAAIAQGMELLQLESSENLKVSFQASKYDIEKLKLGQTADVVISGRVYQGEISKINRMASRNETNTPMVGVEIHLSKPDENIILGMDAKLTIYTQKAENVLMIPVEAINADKKGDFVYVVENGVVAKRAVVCGITTDLYTEIKEGISEEDVIILSAFTALEEGMVVTVMPQTGGIQ